MSVESKKEIQLEIAHVLFIDIVDYSKLSINEQRSAVDELTRIVRATEQFRKAEASERLVKIATGTGICNQPSTKKMICSLKRTFFTCSLDLKRRF